MPPVYSDLQVTSYIQQFFERFQRIEEQLALLSQQSGVSYDRPGDAVPADVVELARSGDRLGAVKRYRELTGADFKDAQEVVTKL